MKNINSALAALLVYLMAATAATAAPCDRSEWDRADHFMRTAAQEVVDKEGGGQDVRHQIIDCDYNTFNQNFRIRADIYWNGVIFRSKNYSVSGDMIFGFNGQNRRFSESWASQSLRDYRRQVGWMAVGAVVILGASALASDQAPAR